MTSDSPDIKTGVDRSRGLLKRIQLLVPGYSGYRKLEDLRAADELLRGQISGILQQALISLEQERAKLVNAGNFSKLTAIGSGISKVQQAQGEMLHSQQGYSGISPTIRIGSDALSGLYDYDLKFLNSAEKIRDLSDFTSSNDIGKSLENLLQEVEKTRSSWNERILAVKKILLTTAGEQQ